VLVVTQSPVPAAGSRQSLEAVRCCPPRGAHIDKARLTVCKKERKNPRNTYGVFIVALP